MSELWLIHAPQAATQLQHFHVSLHRSEGEHWQSSAVYKGSDFLGSAEFLESVNQPDTELVLLLDREDAPERHEAELWVCLEDSPPRLGYATLKGAHLNLIAQLKHLGLGLQVIGRSASGAPDWTQSYVKVNRAERRALEQWVKTRGYFKHSGLERIQLALYLLLKAGQHWGTLTLMSALLLVMAYLSGSAGLEALEQQRRKLGAQHQSQIQALEKSAETATSKADWGWLTEVLKGFPADATGPNALAIQWDTQGRIELWLLGSAQGRAQGKSQGKAAALTIPHPDCKRNRTGDLLCKKALHLEGEPQESRLTP